MRGNGITNKLYVNVHVLFTCLCLVALVACHGGPEEVKFSSKQFNAEWVIYEINETMWANFTLKVPVKGMISIFVLFKYSLTITRVGCTWI